MKYFLFFPLFTASLTLLIIYYQNYSKFIKINQLIKLHKILQNFSKCSRGNPISVTMVTKFDWQVTFYSDDVTTSHMPITCKSHVQHIFKNFTKFFSVKGDSPNFCLWGFPPTFQKFQTFLVIWTAKCQHKNYFHSHWFLGISGMLGNPFCFRQF